MPGEGATAAVLWRPGISWRVLSEFVPVFEDMSLSERVSKEYQGMAVDRLWN